MLGQRKHSFSPRPDRGSRHPGAPLWGWRGRGIYTLARTFSISVRLVGSVVGFCRTTGEFWLAVGPIFIFATRVKEGAYLEFLRMPRVAWPGVRHRKHRKPMTLRRESEAVERAPRKPRRVVSEDEAYERWDAERRANADRGSFCVDDFR